MPVTSVRIARLCFLVVFVNALCYVLRVLPLQLMSEVPAFFADCSSILRELLPVAEYRTRLNKKLYNGKMPIQMLYYTQYSICDRVQDTSQLEAVQW